ncbi:MAG: hypothetical protein M0R06_00505 [Sphaerochaeta sp.]|jgi:hypothetical protein|nr:hypothetical protein [Sphaerochaeta sp.]
MSIKFWDAIHNDAQRDRLWRKFPDIRPPDHRLDDIEPIPEIVNIMREAPKGETACIGKCVVIIRCQQKKGGA